MKIIAITGPAGSGKSTVANMLAKQIDQCVNIDADHVKHMIVSAFKYDLMPDGTKKWRFEEWPLVGDSIGMLAKKFWQAGYHVIINGYIDQVAWENIQKQITFTDKFLLLPELETVKRRDKQRPDDQPMGDGIVTEHHDYFSSTAYYQDFTRLDTTDNSVEETVDEILKILGEK